MRRDRAWGWDPQGLVRVARAPEGLEIRVDRSGGALGNPFVMTGEAARDAVCDAHAEALAQAVSGATPDLHEIARHHGVPLHEAWVGQWGSMRGAVEAMEAVARCTDCDVQLACHCDPRRCHAWEIAAHVCAMRRRP